MAASKIVVLGTGGTIAGTSASADDNVGYVAGQVGVGELLAALPTLRHHEMLHEQVAQLDSKDMDFATWQVLSARVAYWLGDETVMGIIITHGTDTLEETSFFLHAMHNPAKPVVLTCAMRPSTALAPDGPQNLLDAVAVAVTPGARGVVAVCAGTIHGARDVRKVHPYRLDAFSSGEAGAIGFVEEGAVRLLRPWPDTPTLAPGALAGRLAAWPRVEIVQSYAGANGAIVDALVAQGVNGIVVASTGNGSVHRDLEAALRKAQLGGVRVVRATRCEGGRILPVAGQALPDSGGLSPVKARIALMLELLALHA